MLKSLSNFDVQEKRVLLRCDFNVPLDEKGNILDDFRIKKSLPTIEYLIEKGAKPVLLSHLGRPKKGQRFSLKPVALRLEELLKRKGEESKLSSSPFVKTWEFESYFTEEWNSLLYSLKPKNISFRVIRPIGFFHFFQYLKNYGFFKKENLPFTKKILTKGKKDNVTLGLVKISGIKQKKKKEVIWKIFSFAKKDEKLNYMQKITALVQVAILDSLSQNEIKNKGILFLEEIAKNKELFQEILAKIKKKVDISRRISYN